MWMTLALKKGVGEFDFGGSIGANLRQYWIFQDFFPGGSNAFIFQLTWHCFACGIGT
jgi:hypothetical protein